MDAAHEYLGYHSAVKGVFAVYQHQIGLLVQKLLIVLIDLLKAALLFAQFQIPAAAGVLEILRLHHGLYVRRAYPLHPLGHGQKGLYLVQHVHMGEAHKTDTIFFHS